MSLLWTRYSSCVTSFDYFPPPPQLLVLTAFLTSPLIFLSPCTHLVHLIFPPLPPFHHSQLFSPTAFILFHLVSPFPNRETTPQLPSSQRRGFFFLLKFTFTPQLDLSYVLGGFLPFTSQLVEIEEKAPAPSFPLLCPHPYFFIFSLNFPADPPFVSRNPFLSIPPIG